MEHIQLYTKISQLPGDLKTEVNDFIDFLLSNKEKEESAETTSIWLYKRRDIYITRF